MLSRIRSGETENGEHGATTTRVIAKRAASWKVSITRCVSARIAASSSTHESGGKSALRAAHRHRAARCVKAQADLARDLDLVVDATAVRPEIGMVARRRAAREQQLRARYGGRAAQRGRREPGPDRIERDQPIEQLDVLGAGNRARQRLIEVMMSIDQAGNDDTATRIDDAIGVARHFGCRAERLDRTVTHEDRRIAQHTVRIVKRLDVRRIANQQRAHAIALR